MGDIIHAMVALQFIKQQYPDVVIDWVVEEVFAPVLQDNPHINQILPVSLKSIKQKNQIYLRKLNWFSNIHEIVMIWLLMLKVLSNQHL